MLDHLNSAAKSIHEKRTAMGLTQGEFASLLGLGPSGERTVGGWERGEHVPTRAKLEKIFSLPDTIPFRSPYDSKEAKPDFRFIDLFAGIGGIRMPFQELGGHCVFSSEWDKFSQKSYAAITAAFEAADVPRD